MLTTDWKTWCRLCAGANGKKLKLDTIERVSNILQHNIGISLSSTDDLSACEDCLELVRKIEKFTLLCTKVNEMFVELLNGNVTSDKVDSIRRESDDYRNGTKLETREYLQTTSKKINVNNPCVDVRLVEPQLTEGLIHTKTEEPDTPDENDSKNDNTSCASDRKIPKLTLINSANCLSKPKEGKHSYKSQSTRSSIRKYVKDSDVWCHLCDINFNQHRLYIRHMREKHSPEVLPYACEQCQKFFASEKKMLQHAARHRPVEQKKIYPCSQCDRTFSRAENVHLHIRSVHLGVRSFICEECGKAWATKQQLQKHQLMHTDARPFKCSHCAKCFKDSTSLKKHLEIHSNVSFECLLCGQRSSTRYTLREHMLVHSDEKRYKCQYCGNTFKRYKTLKNHLILHTGRPYSCSFCDITYSNEPNLRAHKKKFHPMELTAME